MSARQSLSEPDEITIDLAFDMAGAMKDELKADLGKALADLRAYKLAARGMALVIAIGYVLWAFGG